MTRQLDLTASRTYPMLPGPLFGALLPLPLPRLFAHGYGPIPAVGSVSGQTGDWGSAGQTRRIHLRGAGTMREVLREVAAPVDDQSGGSFAYELGELTGPLGVLADRIYGSWKVEPVGSGSRVTWRWTVSPQSSPAEAVLPALGPMWRGYARRALGELEILLLPR